jgi:protein-disulfide isomerase
MRNNCRFLLLALILSSLAFAQDVKSSILKPPKGAQVALVVFEDLECPDCARAAPLLEEAAKTYNIPLVRHDFPLPMHPWAFDAAILARYFDTHSRKIGNEFRMQAFAHQLEINKDNLHAFAEKFAAEHKIDLPFVIDAQGKLADEVRADRDLGQKIGLEHTPTIYVVSNKSQGKPFVEVVDRSQLFAMIDSIKKE